MMGVTEVDMKGMYMLVRNDGYYCVINHRHLRVSYAMGSLYQYHGEWVEVNDLEHGLVVARGILTLDKPLGKLDSIHPV